MACIQPLPISWLGGHILGDIDDSETLFLQDDKQRDQDGVKYEKNNQDQLKEYLMLLLFAQLDSAQPPSPRITPTYQYIENTGSTDIEWYPDVRDTPQSSVRSTTHRNCCSSPDQLIQASSTRAGTDSSSLRYNPCNLNHIHLTARRSETRNQTSRSTNHTQATSTSDDTLWHHHRQTPNPSNLYDGTTFAGSGLRLQGDVISPLCSGTGSIYRNTVIQGGSVVIQGNVGADFALRLPGALAGGRFATSA